MNEKYILTINANGIYNFPERTPFRGLMRDLMNADKIRLCTPFIEQIHFQVNGVDGYPELKPFRSESSQGQRGDYGYRDASTRFFFKTQDILSHFNGEVEYVLNYEVEPFGASPAK
jgi:hypothetical protein